MAGAWHLDEVHARASTIWGPSCASCGQARCSRSDVMHRLPPSAPGLLADCRPPADWTVRPPPPADANNLRHPRPPIPPSPAGVGCLGSECYVPHWQARCRTTAFLPWALGTCLCASFDCYLTSLTGWGGGLERKECCRESSGRKFIPDSPLHLKDPEFFPARSREMKFPSVEC